MTLIRGQGWDGLAGGCCLQGPPWPHHPPPPLPWSPTLPVTPRLGDKALLLPEKVKQSCV